MPPATHLLRSYASEVATIARDRRLLAWGLFVVLFPIYVVPSGLPQPSAWLLLITAPSILRIWSGPLPGTQQSTLRALGRFLGYVVIANILWSLFEGTLAINLKHGFFLSPFFYLYNAFLLVLFLLLYKRYGDRLLWLTARAVLASVALQVIVALVMPTRLRAAASFNEPNQLGYYALCCACILLLCQRKANLSRLAVTIGLVMCSYLALVSASKAAMGSIGLLGIVLLVGSMRTMVMSVLVLAVLMLTPNPFSSAIERAEQRFATDKSHGFIEERGYDRIANHPEYWLLGSGEGAYERFRETTVIGAHELHSSLGTLFFCYGIVGFTLFLIFALNTMRGSGWQAWLVMGPGFAYGMTHQGIRFSFMWVLFGVTIAIAESNRVARAKRRAEAPKQAILPRRRSLES